MGERRGALGRAHARAEMGAEVFGRREVTAGDGDFLLELYVSTRREELAATGWDAAALDAFSRMQFQLQQHHYRARYPGAEHCVLTVRGQPAGALMTWRGEREIVIVSLALLPAYRGSGIGTRCLIDLMRDAAAKGARVRLSVRPQNRARRLYRRLGFRELSEDLAQVSMEWSAGAETAA